MEEILAKLTKTIVEGVIKSTSGKIAITIAIVAAIAAMLMGCSATNYVRQTTWRSGGDTITMIFEQVGNVTKK